MGKLRKEYDDALKWNVNDIFKDEEEFNKVYLELETDLEKYNKYKGHLLDNENILCEALDFDNEFNKKLESIYVYAHLNNDQDTSVTKYQTMFGKAYKLYEKYNETTSFMVPELLKSDYKDLEEYIRRNPKLKNYERVLKDIMKYKEHTLSEIEEKLLSSMTTSFNTPDEVYGRLTDTDLKFGFIENEDGKKEELTEKSYRKFIESKNRSVRKTAFTTLLNTYGNFKNTYASLLSSEVSNNNKIASIRGYKSALASSLYKNDIPESIYTNLIDSVKRNIKPLSNFWKLKRKALNVSKLHLYDVNAPIVSSIDTKYTIKEARDLLFKSLDVLGSTYINDLKSAFTDRWIDFPPNDNKRNGAYCTACYSTHPYVLLSFDGSLNNVSTLAHELGHAMHYYYAINNQSYQDYGYSIFVAEVASQVNQILLSKYLINNTKDIEMKKYLIDDLIRDFKAAIYRQTMFADFEREIHNLEQNGEVLTHEVLSDLYYKLNIEYNGDNIIVDECVKYEWERIPHFYMNFYVYQYATAYAAAIKISLDILNKKPKAVDNYLEFLKLGATKTPIDSLKVAGVDMNDSQVLDEAFKYFDDLVSELSNLYD